MAGGKFQPGQSGNPGGRYKGDNLITDALRKAAVEVVRTRKGKSKRAQANAMRRLDKMAQSVWRKAEKGSMPHVHYVTDRLEGKVAQTTEGRVTHSVDEIFLDMLRSFNGLKPLKVIEHQAPANEPAE